MFGESDTEPESTDSEVSDVEHAEQTEEVEVLDDGDDTDVDGESSFRWRRHLRPLLSRVPDDDFEDAPENEVTPLEYFHLFLNEEMIYHLTLETNRYSVEVTGQSIDCKLWEMKKFVGIAIQMGMSLRAY